MKIEKDILMKHLNEAAIEQIAFEYRNNGYEIQREFCFGDIKADLIARKDNKLIVFEFKYTNWDKRKKDEIKQLRNIAVREHGASFKLVLVNQPGEIVVEVDNLEQILLNIVTERPTLYDQLAIYTEIHNISDVDLCKVAIHKDEIELIGSAMVNMILQYGSDTDVDEDSGLRSDESFMLDFHILFDWGFEVKEIIKFNLDTSDYYDSQDVDSLQLASKS
ncbi:MAG: hypothetical protein AAB116_02210 [Candidatus Poribacteria bacterium]